MNATENGDHVSPRPNILWICTDQQRWDTLGCYGNTWTSTPHLDRLAAGGVAFENAFSQSPVCTPSRASFLTGRYPRTTGARQNGQSISADEILVTRTLHDAGYIGGLSGKLHLSTCFPTVSPGTERRIDDGYDEFHWSHHPDPDWPTNEYSHWLAEQNAAYARTPRDDCKYVDSGMPESLHHTTWCAQKAIEFIESNAEFDHPWVFSVNIFDPHHPFDPPPEYLDRYLDRLAEIPLPNYQEGELAGKPLFQSIDHDGAYGGNEDFPYPAMTDHDHRMIRAAYWAMCDLIDVQVGRMMETLERTGQLENTVVVFQTDHGEMLGDHGIYLKGPYFYEPAVHVPLIISWPGRIPAGRRANALVELTDVAPTLLDAVGLPRTPGMQGRSLWPLLIGGADRGGSAITTDRVERTDLGHFRDDVYCEYYNAMPWHPDPKPQATMLRTDTHKLVVEHTTGTGELYDLGETPLERHNHWDDPAALAVKATLLQRLSDRMAWTVDPEPPRAANF